MSIIVLKILPEYYKEVLIGNKTFEIRKNDRDFKVGDTIILMQYDGEKYMDSEIIEAKISYVTDFMQKDNYVVLGLKNTSLKVSYCKSNSRIN